MKPSKKTLAINQLIHQTFGVDREKSIRSDVCALCGKPAIEFEDELSRKEFSISGMCQSCQDKAFREE